MPLIRAMAIGAAFLVAATLVAQAQPYPYNQAPPYNHTPVTPQSWSYDPYTSGAAPCPARDTRRLADLRPKNAADLWPAQLLADASLACRSKRVERTEGSHASPYPQSFRGVA
jgi:hypothetical protein